MSIVHKRDTAWYYFECFLIKFYGRNLFLYSQCQPVWYHSYQSHQEEEIFNITWWPEELLPWKCSVWTWKIITLLNPRYQTFTSSCLLLYDYLVIKLDFRFKLDSTLRSFHRVQALRQQNAVWHLTRRLWIQFWSRFRIMCMKYSKSSCLFNPHLMHIHPNAAIG